mmetsp:Transcript_12274/g.28908  ORF Transcript_12274/g.28908 Transcript_12274/m.28908 type:complete len:208 (+) Transcript_12274:2969-3592(+)
MACKHRTDSTASPTRHKSTSFASQYSTSPDDSDMTLYVIDGRPSDGRMTLQLCTVPENDALLTDLPMRGSHVFQFLPATQRGQYQSPLGTRDSGGLSLAMLYFASHPSQISTMELKSDSCGLMQASSSRASMSGRSGARTQSKNSRSKIRSVSSAELTMTLDELTKIEFWTVSRMSDPTLATSDSISGFSWSFENFLPASCRYRPTS